jgi:hypothetical protein
VEPTDPRPAEDPTPPEAEDPTPPRAETADLDTGAGTVGDGDSDGGGDPAEAIADAEREDDPGPEAHTAGGHPVLVYTGLRLAILVAVGGVLYLLGARGLLLLVFAFLISGLIAMVALRRPREGAAYGITSSVRKVNERIDAASRAEDDDDIDEVMGSVAPDRSTPPTPPTA